jgi:acyl-CoA thioesterase FadM
MASRGLRFAYEVHKPGDQKDERLATGFTEHLWVETATGRPCRTPEAVRAAFERLAGRAA